MELCQAAKKDLWVVSNGYHVCGVISSGREKDLLVVYNWYQVCGVKLISSKGKNGTAGGLQCYHTRALNSSDSEA